MARPKDRSSKAAIAVLCAAGMLALAGCGGEGDEEAFCDRAQEAQAAGRDLSSVGGRPKAAAEALGDASAAAEEAADVAPEEISADAEQVARFLDEIATQARKAKSRRDRLEVAQTFQEQVADVRDANDSVDAYVEENCER